MNFFALKTKIQSGQSNSILKIECIKKTFFLGLYFLVRGTLPKNSYKLSLELYCIGEPYQFCDYWDSLMLKARHTSFYLYIRTIVLYWKGQDRTKDSIKPFHELNIPKNWPKTFHNLCVAFYKSRAQLIQFWSYATDKTLLLFVLGIMATSLEDLPFYIL